MATLLHDDIIDRSPLRRHKSSPLVKFGDSNTLLTGDFLLVRAFSLCARLDPFVIEETEKACVELTEGEIIETNLNKETHTLNSSLRIAKKKTASLFRLAALTAVHLAGCNEIVLQEAASYGESLGIAFQILDDILDVTSSEDLLGKKSGTDLHERKPSIVNVLWLNSGSTLAKKLLDAPSKNEDDFVNNAIKEITSGKTIEKAKELAFEYTDLAAHSLDRAAEAAKKTDSKALKNLKILIDFTVERVA